jgi:serine/threonine protein kinase
VRSMDITIPRDGSASGFDPGGGAAIPRVLKQRFVLEERLGSGGMGTVYRARDLRKVEAGDRHPWLAIKVLNHDLLQQPEAFIALQRETARAQALSHPNIVSIFDFDKDGDLPFMLMELLDGQDLADLLAAFPTGLPPRLVWKIAHGIAAGLGYAHDMGIVHADLKPGNVFIRADRGVKLLDFGLACAVAAQFGPGATAMRETPAALTPAFASPELLGGQPADSRDDLFALGLVVYIMLTGRHPFDRIPADQAFREGLLPPRPKGLGRRPWACIERCLAPAREQRPASAREAARGWPRWGRTPRPAALWRMRAGMLRRAGAGSTGRPDANPVSGLVTRAGAERV